MTSHRNEPMRWGRRDALKLGGFTISFAALAAACGTDRTGDDAPGRVGYAPPVEDLEDYPIDDAVLADHQTTADEMGQLTESVGGVAWECTNPWYMERLVDPLLAAVLDSDNPERDIVNSAVALENIAAATHQSLTVELGDVDASAATMAAATLESRHSAAIVSLARGPEGYVSPTISGGEAPVDADGVPLKFAITDRFGSTGQIELVVGKPNENGVRQTFILQTPSLNALIYNELEPTC
jgi:hypothetical protein